MSIFVWVKPTAVEQLGEVYGFTVQKAKGEGRHFIESHDSILDPAAEIRRVPSDAILYVTLRDPMMRCSILPGLYRESWDDVMLVREVPGKREPVRQGFFTVERDVTHDDKRNVSVKASSLLATQDIVVSAIQGLSHPTSEIDAAVMAALA